MKIIKNRKICIICFLICICLLAAGCSSKSNSDANKAGNTNSETASTGANASGSANTQPTATAYDADAEEAKQFIVEFLNLLSEKDYYNYLACYSNGPSYESDGGGKGTVHYNQGDARIDNFKKATEAGVHDSWPEKVESITDIEVIAQIKDEHWFDAPPYTEEMEKPYLFVVKCNVKYNDDSLLSGTNYFLIYTQVYENKLGVTEMRDLYPFEDYLTAEYEPDQESAQAYFDAMRELRLN